MGFFGDLAMGLGLKDRDASYYDRTAATIGRTQGAGREAQYRQSRAYTEQPTRGGPAAMIGSAIDRRREGQSQGGWGYGEGDARVSALRDMLDGGGRGRAGQRFEGGMLANLANALGIRPLGYEERLAAARPQARPTRAAAPSEPNWKNPVAGMSIDGQGARFGEIDQSLSFGGQPLPQYPTSSPLAFGSPFQNAMSYGPQLPPTYTDATAGRAPNREQAYFYNAYLNPNVTGGQYSPAQATRAMQSYYSFYPRGR